MVCLCDMNRKSFYYHFKDKFDLIDWIYSAEINAAAQGKNYTDKWEFISDMCGVIWQNRKFYRQVFQIKGQNSLYDSMSEILHPLIKNSFGEENCDVSDFCIEFISDALICSIEKWVCGKDLLEPEMFVSQLKESILQAKEIM